MRLEGHNVLLNQHKSQCRIEPKLKSHSSDVTTEFLISLAHIGLNHSTLLGRHNPRVIQGSVPGPAHLYSWKKPSRWPYIIIILDTILNRITNRRTIVDQPDSLQVYNYTRR